MPQFFIRVRCSVCSHDHWMLSGQETSRDHHLTTTHTKAREASSEKASRAFYMVLNFVHNRRKTALRRRLALCVWELRPGRPLVRVQSGAPIWKLHFSLINEAEM